MSGNLGLYFEAAAVITVLVLLGQVLELKARAKPAGRSRHCLDWLPRPLAASRRRDDSDVELNAIQVGDTLRVRPGEKIPTDGVVTEDAVQ